MKYKSSSFLVLFPKYVLYLNKYKRYVSTFNKVIFSALIMNGDLNNKLLEFQNMSASWYLLWHQFCRHYYWIILLNKLNGSIYKIADFKIWSRPFQTIWLLISIKFNMAILKTNSTISNSTVRYSRKSLSNKITVKLQNL